MDKDQINRLGFGAWAENIIVNFIEDWGDTIRISQGDMNIDNDSYTLRANWTEESLNVVIRAYTPDGWQTLDQNIKLK